MDLAIQNRLTLAHQLADIAGTVIRGYFRQPHLASETKTGEVSAMVTQADQEAEAVMVQAIAAQFPQDGWIREEGEDKPSQSGYSWVMDPIDGTAAFVRGFPLFGVLIALVDAQRRPVFGIADQPISGDRWQGVMGETSLWNGQPLTNPYARDTSPLATAALVATTPRMFTTPAQQQQVEKFYGHCQRTAFGGDCFNYLAIASGWTAMATVILEADMKFYDFCALIPILQGADISLTDWQGGPLTEQSTEILAATSRPLHQQALDLLAKTV